MAPALPIATSSRCCSETGRGQRSVQHGLCSRWCWKHLAYLRGDSDLNMLRNHHYSLRSHRESGWCCHSTHINSGATQVGCIHLFNLVCVSNLIKAANLTFGFQKRLGLRCPIHISSTLVTNCEVGKKELIGWVCRCWPKITTLTPSTALSLKSNSPWIRCTKRISFKDP